MKRLLSLVVAVSGALLLSPAASLAVTSTQSGWWTSAPLPAPDVPPGGILLQGGPNLDRPIAYGAVSFTLAANEEPGDLTLVVAASSATTPNASITVCPLTTPFTPTEGGPLADGPAFDCTAKAVASRSGDGRTFAVDVGDFARNGALAVALLPTALTDRIVLEAPAATSLSTSVSSTPAPSTNAVTTPGTSIPSAVPPTFAPTQAAGGPRPSSGATAPDPRPTPTPTPEDAPVEIAGAPAADDHSSIRGIAFLALVVLTGALWLFAGTAHDNAPAGATEAASSPSGGTPP